MLTRPIDRRFGLFWDLDFELQLLVIESAPASSVYAMITLTREHYAAVLRSGMLQRMIAKNTKCVRNDTCYYQSVYGKPHGMYITYTAQFAQIHFRRYVYGVRVRSTVNSVDICVHSSVRDWNYRMWRCVKILPSCPYAEFLQQKMQFEIADDAAADAADVADIATDAAADAAAAAIVGYGMRQPSDDERRFAN